MEPRYGQASVPLPAIPQAVEMHMNTPVVRRPDGPWPTSAPPPCNPQRSAVGMSYAEPTGRPLTYARPSASTQQHPNDLNAPTGTLGADRPALEIDFDAVLRPYEVAAQLSRAQAAALNPRPGLSQADRAALDRQVGLLREFVADVAPLVDEHRPLGPFEPSKLYWEEYEVLLEYYMKVGDVIL